MNLKQVPFNVLTGRQKKIAFNMLYDAGLSEIIISNIDILLDERGMVMGYRILKPVSSQPHKKNIDCSNKPVEEWESYLEVDEFIKYMKIHGELDQLHRDRKRMLKMCKKSRKLIERIAKCGSVMMDVVYIVDGRLFLGTYGAFYEDGKLDFRLNSIGSTMLVSRLINANLSHKFQLN